MSAAGMSVIMTAPSTMRERNRAATPSLPCPTYTLRTVRKSSTSSRSNRRKSKTSSAVSAMVCP